jgi:hypothetical protein
VPDRHKGTPGPVKEALADYTRDALLACYSGAASTTACATRRDDRYRPGFSPCLSWLAIEILVTTPTSRFVENGIGTAGTGPGIAAHGYASFQLPKHDKG